MKRFEKVLCLAAIVGALGWISASTAFAAVNTAPGTAWTTTSLPRNMRGEGNTEVAGEVVLTNTVAGNLEGGSTIDTIYSANITNFTSVPAVFPVMQVDIVCFGSAPWVAACAGGVIVIPSIVGTNTVRLSFVSAVDIPVAANDSILIAHMRVDTSAAGCGPVTATLSGVSSSPGTNPVSFNDPIKVVGNPFCPSLPATVPATGTFPAAIATCGPPSSTGGTNFTITAKEAYAAVLTKVGTEAVFSGFPAGFLTNGDAVVVSLAGVPAGFIVTPTAIASTGASTFGALPTKITQTVAGTPVIFYFGVVADDLATAEKITMSFNIGTLNGVALAAGGLTGAVTATVKIGPVTTAGALRFSDNTQGSGVVANITDCRTVILFPWLVNTNDGVYDSGIAVSNMSLPVLAPTVNIFTDPLGVVMKGESGDCTLYLSAADGSTAPAPIDLGVVLAGQSATAVISSKVGKFFVGSGVMVCNFRYAHAFAFIDNPKPGTGGAFAEGYLGVVVPNNPRIAVTESAGL